MTDLDTSTDQLVAELARRLHMPEPLLRTRVGLVNGTAATRPDPGRGTTRTGGPARATTCGDGWRQLDTITAQITV